MWWCITWQRGTTWAHSLEVLPRLAYRNSSLLGIEISIVSVAMATPPTSDFDTSTPSKTLTTPQRQRL
ncbi:hypothetical protein E2542_SST08322 [Spatholobus suberectus]|nr:hypothetical protein E2542_SST08322 [Spatholobus suberectus]